MPKGYSSHLFRSGKCGAVRAGAVFRRRRTAGDLVGVWQGSAIYLSTNTLFVKGGLEESRVTVKLHQVEDLQAWRTKEGCLQVNKQRLMGERLGLLKVMERRRTEAMKDRNKRDEATTGNIWVWLML